MAATLLSSLSPVWFEMTYLIELFEIIPRELFTVRNGMSYSFVIKNLVLSLKLHSHIHINFKFKSKTSYLLYSPSVYGLFKS